MSAPKFRMRGTTTASEREATQKKTSTAPKFRMRGAGGGASPSLPTVSSQVAGETAGRKKAGKNTITGKISSSAKSQRKVAEEKTKPDTLLNILMRDTGHISEVVDSTTGQVISTPEASRGGSMLKGAAQGTTAQFLNLLGLGSNLLNEGVDTAENYTADYAERAIRSIQNSLNTGRLSDGKPVTPAMRQTLLKRLEKYQQEAQERPEGTFEERHPTLSGAQETLYNAADEIGALSQRNIAEAKEGLGSVGQFAVDVGVAGTQLAGDALLAALTGGSALVPMALRSAGGAAQTARQNGADVMEQAVYGLGSGALSAATEKIANVAAPFKAVFGEGKAEKLASALVNRFGENTAIQTMNRLAQTPVGQLAASMLSEGGEEVVEDVFQPVLQRAIYDPDARFDMSEALYDFAVGAVLGGVGGGVDITRRRATDATGAAQTETAPVSITQQASPTQSVTAQNTPASTSVDTGDGAGTTPGTVDTVTDGRASQGVPTPTIQETAPEVNPADAANSVGAAAAGFTGDTERGFARNVSTDQNMAPELRESFREDPEMYFRLGNQKTLAKAQEIFDAGFESARSTLEQAIGQAQAGRKLPPEMVPLSRMVANQLARNGDVYSARKILSDISVELTQAGQLGQAAAIMRNTDPATKTMTIDKLVQNLQKQLSNQGVDLQVDSELLGAYANAETDAARDAALNAIEQNIADQIPSTLLDKWTALRYVNMLGNLKTQVRNLTRNVGMKLINMANNTVASWMESISSKASGGKINRTRSAIVGKDLKRAARADFENVRQEALGDAKFSVENPSANAFYQGVKEKQRVFKSGLFESYRKATNWLMNNEYFGDEAFIRSAYTRSLAGYLKANNVTAEQFSDESWRNGHREFVDRAREFAVKDAQEQTFRDHNTFSDWISRIGRRPDTPKAIQTLSAGMMPFRRTPANVLVRAEEYSPLGLLNTAYLSAQKAASETNLTEARGPGIKGMAGEFARSGQDVTANDIINSLSKSLTGTGIFVLGMALANMGLLRGGPDDDEKQAEFDELTGHQDYSIELPNGLSFTIDWLTPAAMPLLMGAQLEKIREDGDVTLKDLETSLLSIADPMIQMSMLQGVNDTMDSIKFSDDNLGQIAVSTALDYLTQGLTNTLVGQVRRSISGDNTMTYVDKNSIIPDWLQRELGSASKKSFTPAYNQVPYIDAWGRTEETGDFFERLVNNTLNPSYISQIDVDDVEQELQRVYDATGESVFPSRADKTITSGGREKNLTAEEYTRYAKDLGQTRYRYAQDAMRSSAYRSMSSGDKAKFIGKMYEVANAQAKKNAWSAYQYDSEMESYAEAEAAGISATEFYVAKNTLNNIESDKDKNGESINGTRKPKVIDAINEMDLTPKEKDWLFLREYDSDSAKREVRRLPWN